MDEKRRAPQKRKVSFVNRVARAIVNLSEGANEQPKNKHAVKKPQQQKPKTAKETMNAKSGSSKPQHRSAPTGKSAPAKSKPTNGAKRPTGTAPKPEAPRRPKTPEEIRRAKIARAKALRRHKRNMKIGIAVTAFLLIMIVLSRTVFFKIQNIEVTNLSEGNYTQAQIEQNSGVISGKKNLFSCDTDKVARDIEQKLPYIGKAEVSRKFPTTLKITITPTKAAAAIAYAQGYLLVDKDGKMLESVSAAPEGIPVLRCEVRFEANLGHYIGVETDKKKVTEDTKASEEMIALFHEIVVTAEKMDLIDLTLIDIRDERGITLMYQNRLTLHLGDRTQLPTKLSTASKVIAEESDSSKTRMGAIDLTSPPYAYVQDRYSNDTATTVANGENN